jgi:tRNA A37 threonylcarbamoyladenosine biosynthesis protein TsaE
MQVIGLSGVAGSGKDLFCQYLISELGIRNVQAKRYALADRLKEEANKWLVNYDIDIFTCDRTTKEMVRPFLVFHGKMRRLSSKGVHWTTILQSQINGEQPEVAIVTDVRYDDYEKDEVTWLKSMKGVLVHISAYRESSNGRNYILPPNEDEAKNDPKVKAKADHLVDWQVIDSENLEERYLRLRPHVVTFINRFLIANKSDSIA